MSDELPANWPGVENWIVPQCEFGKMSLHLGTASGSKIKAVNAGLSKLGIENANWNGHIYGEPKAQSGPSLQVALDRSGCVIYTRRSQLTGMHTVNECLPSF